MVGQHADVIIADSIVKGVVTSKNVNLEEALAAMVLGATTPRPEAGLCCVEEWLEYGYVPNNCKSGCAHRGASETLAYAYDASAISTVATKLGKKDIAEKFFNLSMNWKNVWNSEYLFMCPKTSEGKWDCPETWLNIFDSRYVEGDGWQWRVRTKQVFFFLVGKLTFVVILFCSGSFLMTSKV
jgi:putative alpha-1,2-mannosidase